MRGRLCGDPGGDFRKVDVGLGHVVDVVGQHIEGHGHDDLDHGAIVEVGFAQRCEVGVGDPAVRFGDAAGEAQRSGSTRVARTAVAGRVDLIAAELGDVAAEVVMRTGSSRSC